MCYRQVSTAAAHGDAARALRTLNSEAVDLISSPKRYGTRIEAHATKSMMTRPPTPCELTPSTLGQLMAIHENRTVATAALLGINPFDQWGVELGKQMAGDLADGSAPKSELLRRAQSLREN